MNSTTTSGRVRHIHVNLVMIVPPPPRLPEVATSGFPCDWRDGTMDRSRHPSFRARRRYRHRDLDPNLVRQTTHDTFP